tara:strand:+ start:471 stop:1181 length:711 start_codon:yes stop_codon:yes gene_type:complete
MKRPDTVKIIAEIHPQHRGSINEIKRMILQCKISGADIVKVQLYDGKKLFNNDDRKYLEISKDELAEINDYCKNIDIELSASIFNLSRVDWCEELNFKTYKIASRTVEDKELCEKIISLNKKVIISLGMYDYEKKGIPFEGENLEYLYCISKYPTNLKDIKMPNFENSFFSGYSDHTIGIGASIFAVSKGAKIIEKHFSNNKSLNIATEMAHVCSMDQEDLKLLRNLVDSIKLLQS